MRLADVGLITAWVLSVGAKCEIRLAMLVSVTG